jgi:hypothetical protein
MPKELTKKQKIDVLNQAKLSLLKTAEYHGYSNGLCFEIRRALQVIFGAQIINSINEDRKIRYFIPEFTMENARRISVKYNLYIEEFRTSKDYWWSRNDIDSREKFLDLLIKTIEEK